jgi:hypothetical protein
MQGQRAKDNSAQAQALKADGLGYGPINKIPLSLFFVTARRRRAGTKNKDRGQVLEGLNPGRPSLAPPSQGFGGQVSCPGLNYACAFSAAERASLRRLCGKKHAIKANNRSQRTPRARPVCILRLSGAGPLLRSVRPLFYAYHHSDRIRRDDSACGLPLAFGGSFAEVGSDRGNASAISSDTHYHVRQQHHAGWHVAGFRFGDFTRFITLPFGTWQRLVNVRLGHDKLAQ